MSAKLAVLSSPLDYSDAEYIDVDAGKTIETMVIDLLDGEGYRRSSGQCVDIIYIELLENGEYATGELIPSDRWHRTVINAGDKLIASPHCNGIETLIFAVLLLATVYYVSTIDVSIPSEEQIEQSPSYESDPQGNRARLGQPKPVHYGRLRVYPDYASYPIQEVINNDLWGFYIYSIGRGSFDVESLKFGDTPAENFEGFEYAQYEPGQRVTLVPSAAYSAAEVSGSGITLFAPNEPDYAGESGPHPANASGTQANTLLFDFICPRGLNYGNKKGGLDERTASVRVEWREIDDSGQPVDIFSGWQFQDYSYTDATADVLRFTESVEVDVGRYEVRARRLNNSTDSFRENDEIRWSGLRSYLEDDQVFDETIVAVKIKIGAQLSAQAQRRFNLIPTARLPIYDAGAWLPSAPTRNPIWAFCDALKHAGYTDANFRDLDGLAILAAEYDSRGDYFDGRFEARVDLWSGLRRILRVGRAEPINYGDIFDVVRDGSLPRNVSQLTARNTVADSFALQPKPVDQWEDHSVIIYYMNPETWQKEPITCFLPGTVAKDPEDIGLLDTTNRSQAFREGMYAMARRYFRNRIASVTTEMDGRIFEKWDSVLLSSTLPRWGKGGDIIDRNGQELILGEPVEWADNTQHYLWLAEDDGRNSDSFQVNRVYDAQDPSIVLTDRVQVVEPLPDWVYYGYRKEKTKFAFAAGVDQPRMMLVQSARPSGDYSVSLTFVNDDPRVHQFDEQIDDGTLQLPPPVPAPESLDLTIRGVRVVNGGTVDVPELQISWSPVSSADRYFVEIRYDESRPWRRVYDGSVPQARFEVAAGDVYVRIAAMGETVGSWFELGVINAGGEFAIPVTPSGLQLSYPFVGRSLAVEWQDDVRAAQWRVDYSSDGQVRFSQTVDEPLDVLHSDVALLNGLNRTIAIDVYAINANGVPSAVPAQIAATNPQVALLENVSSFVNNNILHVNFDPPDDEDFAGVIAYAGPQGFNPATAPRFEQEDSRKSSIDIPIDDDSIGAVRIAAFDIWGDDNLNLSPEILDVAAGIRESDLNQTLTETIGLINEPGTGLVDRLADEIQRAQEGRDNLQSQITNLDVTNVAPVYRQPAEPVGVIEENSRWFDTDDGNRPYIYLSGAWTDVTDQRILDNAAAIQDEAVVRANQYGSLAAQQATLQVTFNAQIASIETAQTAIINDVDGIKLESYVKLDNNGYVIGSGAFNNGPGASGWIFRVDTFGIGRPGQPDSFPFVFDATTGRFFVQSAYIPNLDVGILTGDVASFISANITNGSIDNAKIGNEIRSNNYSSSAGWLINKNGSAVFRNVHVRGNVEATSLNAATGTFAGVVTGSLAASAVNIVETLHVAGNSIIVKESFQSSAGASSPTSFSRIINMAGTKGLNGVEFGFELGFVAGAQSSQGEATGYFYATVRLFRNGALLRTIRSGNFPLIGSNSSTGYGYFVASHIDLSPVAGINNYSVTAEITVVPGAGSNTSSSFNYRQITLDGVKV